MNPIGERVTSLGALMAAMTVDRESRKTYAVIHYIVHDGEALCRVDEHFDDGKGHSGASRSRMSYVDIEVFEEAKRMGYVTGKLEPGYVSVCEFVLTNHKSLLSEEIWPLVTAWKEEDFFRHQSERDVKAGKPGTYIKIVSLPEGEAPEEIKAAWVGMVLLADPHVGYGTFANGERGVLTGKPAARRRCVYTVPVREALEVLERKHPEAAKWWRENDYPKEDEQFRYFGFFEEEAREFAGAFIHQKISVHDERLGELDH